MPLAVAVQMRTPVNEPGPRPHATHASSLLATPADASAASIFAMSFVFDARNAGVSHEARGAIRARCAIELSYPHGNDLVGGIESEYVIVLWHQISFLFVRLSAADGRRHLLVPLCGSLPARRCRFAHDIFVAYYS